MIKAAMFDTTPLVEIAEEWVAGRLDPAVPAWVGEDRGKAFWSADKPDSPVCKVIRQPSLNTPEVDEPTCVIEWPSGRNRLYLPESHRTEAPYVGRQYIPGTSDCYSLVREYYRREHGIELGQAFITRQEMMTGQVSAFNDHPESANWERVAVGQPGDGLLFTFGEAIAPNHCGVLLDNGMFLHHFNERLSTIEPLTGVWRKHLTHYLRRVDV